MPKWLEGWTVEIAFAIVVLLIGLLRVAARFHDRRSVEFHDVWHRRKNDD